MRRVLNLGAGVQSTAICIMGEMNWEAHDAGQPIPYPTVGLIEFAIFGDTGDEPWRIYMHLCWLVARCPHVRFLIRSIHEQRNRILWRLFPLAGAVNVGRARKYLAWLRLIEKGTLRGSLLAPEESGERFASIPAFTWDGETLRLTRKGGHERDEAKLKRQCTREWKIDCVERTIRREIFGLAPKKWMPRDIVIEQLFGLSWDEQSRIIKVKHRFAAEITWAVPKFPLDEIEQTRGGCRVWLRKHGPPYSVGRSACFHCPLHENEEWVEIRDNDPLTWQEACRIDERLREPGLIVNRGMVGMLFLHRSCKPLREAPIEAKDTKKLQEIFGFARECEGMCGT